MKALKTKVMLSAFVLLFALVATIGSTFAWFTVSNEVRVDQFELTVQTQDSLLIRLYNGETTTDNLTDLQNANTYSTNYTSDMILDQFADFDTWRLTPVTAVQFDDNALGFDDPKLNPFELSILSLVDPAIRLHTITTDSNGADANFIELKFWILSQAAVNKKLYLHNLVVNSNLPANTITGQTDAANAVRLGVGVTSGATGAIDPTEGFVYANRPNSSLTLPYGFLFLEGMRGYNSSTASLNALDQTLDTEIVKLHSLFSIPSGTPKANESAVVAVGSLEAAYTAAGIASLTTLVPNIPQLVTVRIYIEGWDSYANNTIIAAKFNINFSFVIPATSV